MRIRIQLLGSPKVLLPAQSAGHPLPRKGAALLARLAVDGAMSRQVLASQLWPEVSSDKQRGSLRGLLRDLRAQTGCDLVQGIDALELAPGVEHDLLSGPEPGSSSGAPVLLASHEYADLEEFSAWLDSVRTRMRSQWQHRQRGHATQLGLLGHLAEAIAVSELLLDAEPTDESICRDLMRLHCQNGNRGAALLAYSRCKASLAATLQIEPSVHTRALATLIECGEPLPQLKTAHAPAPAWRPEQLVARDVECQTIEEAWRCGTAVWLEGEPGIGKSHLMRHFGTLGAGAVMVSAIEGDAESAYGLLGRLIQALLAFAHVGLDEPHRGELARLRPEFGPMAARPASTQRLAAAFQHALSAWQVAGLTTLLVDDLHWADDASVSMLLGAAAEADALRWMVSSRPTPGLAPPELADRSLPARLWLRLPLGPFDVLSIEKWLRALPLPPADPEAWAERLAEHCRGNPLLLTETLHAMRPDALWHSDLSPDRAIWSSSSRLEVLLATRLERLSGPGLHLAQLVAMSGAAFSDALAVQVLGINPFDLGAHWAELEDQHVVKGDTLVHDSLRGPLLGRLRHGLGREMHGRIAAAAAVLGAEPAEVARHWWLAQDWRQAAPWFEQAARRAHALGARAIEHQLWVRSAECNERVGDLDAAFRARHAAFGSLIEIASVDEVLGAARALLSQARHVGERLDAAVAMARACSVAYQHADAIVHGQHAVALASELGSDSRAVRAKLLICTGLAGTGQHRQAEEGLEALRAEVLASGDARLELDFRSCIGYSYVFAARFDRALVEYTRAVELAEWLDDGAELAVLSSNLAVCLNRQGRTADALTMCQKGQAWRLRVGGSDGAASGMALQIMAAMLARMSRFGEALETAEAALRALGTASSSVRIFCEATLSAVWVSLGRCDLARACLSRCPADAPPGDVLTHILAECLVDAAEGSSTREALLAAQSLTAESTQILRWLLAVRLAAADSPAASIANCRQLAASAKAQGALAVEQAAWLREADALRKMGDPRSAADRLRPALARLTDCLPVDLPMAEVWCIACDVFDAAGLAAEHDDAIVSAECWLHGQALPHVPADHVESFLAGSPFVAELASRIARARDPQ